jgi:hypothetical protein
MSPIDDELRTALRGRAHTVQPVPDPLAGIERRARTLRRNRAAAAVAGSALAIGALAVGVPAVLSTVTPAPATTFASPTAAPVPGVSPYALDPQAPWAYRGDEAVLGDGSRETYAREYAVAKGVAEDQVRFVPLYGLRDEPTGADVLVFLAELPGGEVRWGVVRSGEGGPELAGDTVLEPGTTALPVGLASDEVRRLLVVAADDDRLRLEHAADGTGSWRPMASRGTGIGITPREGDVARDRFRVLDPSGQVVTDQPAEPVIALGDGTEGQTPPGDDVPAPTNVVPWPQRGEVEPELLEQALVDFAEATGASRDELGSRLLYGGRRGGQVLVLLQAWSGGDARAFAWSYELDGGSRTSRLYEPTAPGPAAFAAVFPALPGETTDALLVVPEPTAGQVLYAPDAGSEPRPVADQGTEAAVVIDRTPGTSGDRVLVLDGNGDPDRPVFRGTVDELLAATAGEPDRGAR